MFAAPPREGVLTLLFSLVELLLLAGQVLARGTTTGNSADGSLVNISHRDVPNLACECKRSYPILRRV